jgi:hypothetical protein
MKPRLIIANASYGPEGLKQVYKAFDDAWEIIGPSVGNDPAEVEAARVRLSSVILGLANNGNLDPEQLTNAAVQLMAEKSPGHSV